MNDLLNRKYDDKQHYLNNLILMRKSKLLSKINPIAKLFVKCEKDIYTPVNKVGCEYSKKCELGKIISLNVQMMGKIVIYVMMVIFQIIMVVAYNK